MTGSRVPPLRLGLLGCGGVAFWVHLRSLRRLRDVELVAAADPDPAARARVAPLTRATLAAEPAAVLGRADVEAVLIAAPTALHAELAVAAARAGKHLYLEKPVAMDAAGARHIQEAVAAAGVTAVVGFNRRFHPVHRRARELIASGRIGPVRAVQTAFGEATAAETMPSWKRRRETGGGVLLDLASHHFDLLRWMLGTEPTSVEARTWSEASEQDTAQVWMTLASGAKAHGHFSFRSGVVDQLEFFGEAGRIRVDRHAAVPQVWVRRRRYGVRPARTSMSAADRLAQARHWAHPSEDPSYLGALRGFVARVRGARNDSASLEDGLRSLQLVLAAEASACAVRPLAVAPPGPRG